MNPISPILKKYKESPILSGFVKLFSVDILAKASSFILLPIYLKLMSQSDFGLYNYLISIVGFFSQILNFGLYVAQSKIYQELDEEHKGSFVYTIQLTLLFLIVPSIIIIYGFHLDNYIIHLIFKNPINYDVFRLPLLLAIIASVYSFILYNYFLTAQKVRLVQRYNIAKLILSNALILAALFFFKDKVTARLLTAYIVEMGFVIGLYYFVIKEIKPNFNKQYMFRSMKIGFPVMTAAICSVVINFGDKFLLEKRAGFVDLSIYYLAFSIAGVISILFSTFQNIWLPIFLKERDLKKNILLTRKISWALLGVFICLGLTGILIIKIALAYSFIDMKYDRVLLILPIVMASVIIDCMSHMYTNYITFFEQTYVLPIFSVLLGAFSIGANIYFIKYYGLYGASWSSVIISTVNFLLFYFLFKFNVYKKRSALTV